MSHDQTLNEGGNQLCTLRVDIMMCWLSYLVDNFHFMSLQSFNKMQPFKFDPDRLGLLGDSIISILLETETNYSLGASKTHCGELPIARTWRKRTGQNRYSTQQIHHRQPCQSILYFNQVGDTREVHFIGGFILQICLNQPDQKMGRYSFIFENNGTSLKIPECAFPSPGCPPQQAHHGQSAPDTVATSRRDEPWTCTCLTILTGYAYA